MVRLIFDPGHGLPDPGAVANGFKEYQLAFEIATKTALELTGQYDVIFTRTGPEGFSDDETEDLAARCKIANAADPDLILSFHFNAGGGNGPEVYILPGASSETRAKASLLHNYLRDLYGYGRGVKEKALYILKYTQAPAILLELGFLDSPFDARKIENPVFRAEMARTLAVALRKIFGGGNMKFKDVSPERWSAKSIDRVTALGLMGGYPDGSFKPEQPLSREELASVLDRLTFLDGIFTDVLPQVMPSIVCVNARTNLGSGVCVAKTAQYSYILTNNHVANGKLTFELIKEGEETFQGEHVIADVMKDLALIRTTKSMVPLPLATADPELGQPVAVVGAPIGLTESVTVGVVSHLNREGGKWFQTDAPINPGNSGGPIINERGELTGVAVAKVVAPDVEGIAFGIKLEYVKSFLKQVKDKIV